MTYNWVIIPLLGVDPPNATRTHTRQIRRRDQPWTHTLCIVKDKKNKIKKDFFITPLCYIQFFDQSSNHQAIVSDLFHFIHEKKL